jgi:hypothetical protein
MDGVSSLTAAKPLCAVGKREEMFEENAGERLEYISCSRPLQGLFQDEKFLLNLTAPPFQPISLRTDLLHIFVELMSAFEDRQKRSGKLIAHVVGKAAEVVSGDLLSHLSDPPSDEPGAF